VDAATFAGSPLPLPTKPKKHKKRKRKSKYSEDDEDDEEGAEVDSDDDDYRPFVPRAGESEDDDDNEGPVDNSENPLPGYVDPVSLEEVVKPAISPFGHVMGYANWSRVLSQEPRNVCLFTKKPLKKRDLVVLTWENIDQYRDKIVRLS